MHIAKLQLYQYIYHRYELITVQSFGFVNRILWNQIVSGIASNCFLLWCIAYH